MAPNLSFNAKAFELAKQEQIPERPATAGETHRPEVIAVVDDEPTVRKAIGRLLSTFGYRVELFASATEFRSAAPTSNAKCLILDINLGDESGLELARELSTAGFVVPVIFITGCENNTVRQQCIEFGCVAYLHKPFVHEQLMQAIGTAIQSIRP